MQIDKDVLKVLNESDSLDKDKAKEELKELFNLFLAKVKSKLSNAAYENLKKSRKISAALSLSEPSLILYYGKCSTDSPYSSPYAYNYEYVFGISKLKTATNIDAAVDLLINELINKTKDQFSKYVHLLNDNNAMSVNGQILYNYEHSVTGFNKYEYVSIWLLELIRG